MNLLAAITRQMQLAALNRQFRREEAWIADLEDQVQSGQYALARALERRDKLRAEIAMLESPGVLIAEAVA